jgi:hypothetical protein
VGWSLGPGRLRDLCLIVMISCVAAELGGAGLFAWEHGSLIYVARQEPEMERPPDDNRPAARTPAEAVNVFAARLHPYFGFAGPYEGEVGGLHWNTLGSLQRDLMMQVDCRRRSVL